MTVGLVSATPSVCALCGSGALAPFVRRDAVPVHQNHPEPSFEAARDVQRGDLQLDFCGACGFLSNSAFDQAKMVFGAQYVAEQTWSPAYDRHVDELVDELVASGVRNQRVVEIGCGTGDFLERLCARGGNRGYGYDSAYSGPPTALDRRITFVRRLVDANTRPPEADLFLSRHVLAHVQRPVELLRHVRRAMGSRHAPLFIETAALEWTLEHRVVQDFYYEYCSYHSSPSMRAALARAGFQVRSLRRTFGDQYMWIEAVPGDPQPTPAAELDALRTSVERFRDEYQRLLERWKALIGDAVRRGPVCIWGVGAKGVTFLNLLDPTAQLIAFAVDRNPRKQGRFVAGTGHAILAPEALRERGVGHIVIMNDHYSGEIRAEIDRLGIRATVTAELD